MHTIPPSARLPDLTPELYEQHTKWERKLADYYYGKYTAMVETSRPYYFTQNWRRLERQDLRWAARQAYLHGALVPAEVAVWVGLIGGGLISFPLYGSLPHLLTPGIAVIVVGVMLLFFSGYRTRQINRYFKAHPELAAPDKTHDAGQGPPVRRQQGLQGPGRDPRGVGSGSVAHPG